jgi:hypothetical protein
MGSQIGHTKKQCRALQTLQNKTNAGKLNSSFGYLKFTTVFDCRGWFFEREYWSQVYGYIKLSLYIFDSSLRVR